MNKLPDSGGSYTVDPGGELIQIEAPTVDHPEGNRARDAEEIKQPVSAKKNMKKESGDAII